MSLMPCPFCGGEAECLAVQGNINNPPEFHVTCKSPRCRGYNSESEGIWKQEADAISAWNRRSPELIGGRNARYWFLEYAKLLEKTLSPLNEPLEGEKNVAPERP